ncbi:MAG TPA: thiamine-phosphate kinase, partial [Marinobacter sp.]
LVGKDAVKLALNAGDDYELCITISPSAWESLPDDIRSRLIVIGDVSSGQGLAITSDGQSLSAGVGGYDHFLT